MSLEAYTISPDTPFELGLKRLDSGGKQILLVVDDFGTLLGTITDGDIRRAILRKIQPTVPVREIMNRHPIVAHNECTPNHARSLMIANRIRHIPVVDSLHKLTGIFAGESMIGVAPPKTVAVLMAGGFGKRLGELTRDCPKPMLEVANRPILQIIIEQLRDSGVFDFFLAVNFQREKIKSHFGDGGKFGVKVDYLEENEPLGTAGSLRLIDPPPDRNLLVMNGDILTRVNFGHLIQFHVESRASATMCVREFSQKVPYGVVRVDGGIINDIEEKPATSFLINSGIYVLQPRTLKHIPPAGSFDMPSLFNSLRASGETTIAYPIHEYWIDVGTPDDFQTARQHFE